MASKNETIMGVTEAETDVIDGVDTSQASREANAPAEANTEVTSATLSDEERATLIDLSQRREDMYALLSRMYRVEVDQEFFDGLCAASFPADTGDDVMDSGYRAIALYCATYHEDPLLDLARDYVRVFIGHGNNAYAAAYPFESVYTSEKRLLMQEARDEILKVYREAGLVIEEGWTDPEDHIALELDYMRIMARRVKEALAAGDDDEALRLTDTQRVFLLSHLVNWTPFLIKDMQRLSQTKFYQGLALLTRGFLAQDRQFLESILSGGEEN